MSLIVGIGASAGGLDAFKSFFAATPADSGMAFILVQHLSPDHKSMLADLLGRSTMMHVIEATVLAVEAMPAKLIAYKDHLSEVAGSKSSDGIRTDATSHLQTIMGALRARSDLIGSLAALIAKNGKYWQSQ